MNLLLQVMVGAVRGGTSILYAALGETISERAGVINLGTEGCMLVGALAAYAVTAETGNPWVGVLARAPRPAGCSPWSTPASSCPARPNQLATGLVVLFLGLGLTSLFGAAYVRRVDQRLQPHRHPRPVEHPLARRDLLRPRPAHLPVLRRRAGHVVAAVPQPLGPAGAGRGRAGRGARHLRPLAPAGAVPGRVRRRRPGRHRRRPAVDRLRQRLVREHDRRAGASSPSPW